MIGNWPAEIPGRVQLVGPAAGTAGCLRVRSATLYAKSLVQILKNSSI
jgi:hypothetical protein